MTVVTTEISEVVLVESVSQEKLLDTAWAFCAWFGRLDTKRCVLTGFRKKRRWWGLLSYGCPVGTCSAKMDWYYMLWQEAGIDDHPVELEFSGWLNGVGGDEMLGPVFIGICKEGHILAISEILENHEPRGVAIRGGGDSLFIKKWYTYESKDGRFFPCPGT